MRFFYFGFLFCLFFRSFLHCYECFIEVRILQPIINTNPGQISQVQAEILNNSCHKHILVGHLQLPPLWEAVPSNDILLHIEPGQRAIQNLNIKAPDSACPGKYPIAYEVWARENASIMGRDTGSVIIGERCLNTPIILEITSERFLEVGSGEVIYLSALAQNPSDSPFQGHVQLILPDCWHCFPSGEIELNLDPQESKVLIFGIKIPYDALAGEHDLSVCLNDWPDCKQSVRVKVCAIKDITSNIDGICEFFNMNQVTSLCARYTNEGNVVIKVRLEAETQPPCQINCSSEIFEIQPGETCEIPITLSPESDLEEYSQYLLLKLIDAETEEQLYQNPMTLKFVIPGREQINEPYVRIPAYVKGMVLGDGHKTVLAAELAGAGLIDPEKDRFLEFFFRVPTSTDQVIYNIDEQLYIGVYDRDWDWMLGDTVYELSPLTQRFRYGRGGGFNRYEDNWEGGIHYTQNTVHCSQGAHEWCGYLQYNSDCDYSLSANYLHKVQGCIPTSNIFTLRSVVEYPARLVTELEIGKNFVHKRHKDTWAYRLETHGRLWEDSWFSLEKAYAGSEFWGYYNNLHLLTSSLDFPLGSRWRMNLTLNHFRQDIAACNCENDEESAVIPRQRQYGANLTYLISDRSSFSFNGFLLRADDKGEYPQYDFYQKWLGCTFFTGACGCSFNAYASFGRETDYHRHRTSKWLQHYYTYISKDFSPHLRASLFYDGGNTNFYDTRPWSSSYGCSLFYRFSPRGSIDLFLQKIRHTADLLDLSQITLNFNYTFKNLHKLQAFAQYFQYKSHFPNETLFMVSYSIPFSLPVCRRKDIGDLTGIIYNSWVDSPVPEAYIKCAQMYQTTSPDGSFCFRNIPRGEYTPNVIMLPNDLIVEETDVRSIEVPGGSQTNVCIPVVPSCRIKGDIILFDYKDLFAVMANPENAEIAPVKGMDCIRVAIARNGEEEIYSCQTDSRGGFEFPKLRPGRWHIKIFTEGLPSQHELDMNELVIDLLPGEARMIHYKVLPKRPEIYKVD